MKFAFFLGCTIPARLQQYESSSRAVLETFGIGLQEIKEFNCCGYPIRNTDYRAAILSSARNLALAEKQNLNMLVLCKCGFGMLKHAYYHLKENPALRSEINALLAREGMRFEGDIEIKHLLSVLYHDVGIEAIKEKVTRPFQELKIATHYGCHALRPSEVTQFDDPVNPTLFDTLVEATGAESIDWQARLDCCGAPLFGVNDDLSMDLTEKKVINARKSGAAYLCVGCPYCHIQFDTVQRMLHRERGGNHLLPPILYPQLLGLSLGIDSRALGLEMNHIEITSVEKFLSE
ncbi:MAG: disulfide reductase [Deltaproteobacteria bacterium]|nr:MAG: disulfide reductase [Deltaproteobacteria bacterium]